MFGDAIVALALSLPIAALWLNRVRQNAHRMQAPLSTFGDKEKKKILSRKEQRVILEQYRLQQKSAYALALFAIAVGVILGASVLVKILLLPTTDAHFPQLLAGGVGAAGDVALGTYAVRFYRETTRRLVKFTSEHTG
jgi:hypothetical protein